MRRGDAVARRTEAPARRLGYRAPCRTQRSCTAGELVPGECHPHAQRSVGVGIDVAGVLGDRGRHTRGFG